MLYVQTTQAQTLILISFCIFFFLMKRLTPSFPAIYNTSSAADAIVKNQPLLHFTTRSFSSLFTLSKSLCPSQPTCPHRATTAIATAIHHRRQKKVVVIVGPTGSGKSKLSIDLATHFFPNSEIINSDKIQVYRGLDITTNKISMHDRRGVPHHCLGEFDPDTEFTPSDFRLFASKTIAQIASQRKLPMIVGGSNSFIYALLAKRFNPNCDVFDESKSANSVCTELRYNCCFLWVDVSLPVLNEYLDKRVDDMLKDGMFEELARYFESEGFSDPDSANLTGLKKAIGVPEFERYFKRNGGKHLADVEGRRLLYEEAVKAIKDNTCHLAKRQLGKILRLRDAGWDLHKIDATEAFRAAMMTSKSGERAAEIWGKQVLGPSMKIVKRFLME